MLPTGARQRVGNWPGVTVERKSGFFKQQNTTIEVVDLPGTYSLTVVSESSSIDERIACQYVLERQADVIVNILDASNLERHLYLTLQLIEMRVPMIIALNMMDVARQRQTHILLDELEKKLGCPVVALEALRGKGIKELKQKVVQAAQSRRVSAIEIPYPNVIKETISNLTQLCQQNRWLAMRLLEEDVFARTLVMPEAIQQVPHCQHIIRAELNEDPDILLADARYRFIHNIVTECVVKSKVPLTTLTTRIDNIVLNRLAGIPIFLVTMYCMFLFAINIGGIPRF